MAGYSVTYTVVDEATAKIEAINKRIAQMRAPMERQAKAFQQFVDVSGLRNVADGFGKIWQGVTKTTEAMIRMVPVLGTLIGSATIAGVTQLIDKFSTMGVTLQRNADQIGISSQQLEVLQNATRDAGGSADDMTESLKGLTDVAAGAFTGRNIDAAGWFAAAGIAVKDANGHLRNTADILPDVLHYLDSLKNPADRMQAAMHMGGKALFDLDEEFRRSGQPMDAWIAKAKEQGTLSDDQINKMLQLKQQEAQLGVQFDRLIETITANLAPAITDLLKQLSDWISKNQQLIQQDVETTVKAIADAVKWIANNFEAVKVAFEVLLGLWAASKMLTLANSFINVATAVGRITGALREVPAASKEAEAAMGAPGMGGSMGAGLLGKVGLAAFLMTDVYSKWKKLHDEGIDPSTVAPGSPLELPEQKAKRPPPQSLWEKWTGQAPAAPGSDQPDLVHRLWNRAIHGPEAVQRESAVGGDVGAIQKGVQQATPATATPAPTPGAAATVQTQQQNLRAAMDAQGVTDPSMRAGIEAIAAGEGGFRPHSEDSYANTSNARIRNIFGAHVSGLSDEQLTALKANPQAFFDKVYGGRLGNAPDEGYKYRGRGDFQLTGKGNYERYGQLTGLDLVNNPDLANDPANAAKIAVAYMKDRYHGGGFEGMKRAVGNPVAETEAVKNQAYAEYMRTGQFNAPAQVAQAEGAPAQVTGGPPVNGAIDVTVKHVNPPQGSSVSVDASGILPFNVGPPRVEHQNLSNAA